MLFNSLEYIYAFLPLTVLFYFYLNQRRLTEAAKGVLVFGSLLFYSWWDLKYLPLILGSILFNYIIGISLTRQSEYGEFYRKLLLLVGVAFNLGLLGLYKYADFFIENTNYVLNTDYHYLHLSLPLAISFFTFQQLTFIMDSYHGKLVETDFLNYTVFVTFFPQLIAGPIVHHSEMMPQFKALNNKVLNYRNIYRGLNIFAIGLFKKVVIADFFAAYVSKGFDTVSALNFWDAWSTSLSFTMQIYFDFSGYTDMAIGSALLLNIKLPINFNSPYQALNIQDFWRRWHITLSRFLKDYVYIPLGGNRSGELKLYRNLFLTFLLGGLWHGAGWTFVIWGGLHGLAVVLHRMWGKLGINLTRPLAWFITFNFINVTWVFFRANELGDAIKVLRGMLMGDMGVPTQLQERLGIIDRLGNTLQFVECSIFSVDLLAMIAICGSIALFMRNSVQLTHNLKASYYNVVAVASLIIYGTININKISEFLYFNF